MPAHRIPLATRFWAKVEKSEGCWLWTGAGAPGYGRIQESHETKRLLMAHRLSYEMHVGPIPDGLTIDHLCRNPNCVRPDHLEPVTQAENLRRADIATNVRSAVTHCPHGHEYDDANTKEYVDRRGYPHRECRACKRAYYERTKAKRPHWERVVDPDNSLPPEEVQRLAEEAKRAHHVAIGKASVVARRKKYAAMDLPPCDVSGCDNDAKAYKGGPCNMHYIRLRRHGSYD